MKIKATLIKNQIETNSSEAFTLHQKSNFGKKISQKIIYSTYEALYLTEKNKIQVENFQGKILTKKELTKKFNNLDKSFQTNYQVFKSLTESGFSVKTGLKFGTTFRVYDKNLKHSKWLCEPIQENEKISPKDLAAKTRLANSSNKPLLLAIVDSENDISYFETRRKQL
jgi:tRNA-intron endonuclease